MAVLQALTHRNFTAGPRTTALIFARMLYWCIQAEGKLWVFQIDNGNEILSQLQMEEMLSLGHT